MELIFEWDNAKAKLNLQKHKVSFDEAKSIFNDPLILTLMIFIQTLKSVLLVSEHQLGVESCLFHIPT